MLIEFLITVLGIDAGHTPGVKVEDLLVYDEAVVVNQVGHVEEVPNEVLYSPGNKDVRLDPKLVCKGWWRGKK